MIPLCDLHAEYEYCKADIDEVIARVIRNSSFILSKEVNDFEAAWAKRCGAEDCVGVSSATDGLYLALKASGIGRYHNVLIPAMTVTADAEAVLMSQADVVIGDVADTHGMLTLEEMVRWHRERGLHAVILVHLYGLPHPEIDVIYEFCKSHGIALIEDCAHAHGADVGRHGRFSVWSFFPSKILGCMGDGGAVTSNESLEFVRSARNHGRRPGSKHQHEEHGGNYRLDSLQAAILNAKLPVFDSLLTKRKNAALRYSLELPERVGFQHHAKSSFYVYTIRHEHRDELRGHLADAGIVTGCHYPVPLDKQPIYKPLKFDCPVAQKMANETLSLPMGPFLGEEDQGRVINTVKEFDNG